MTVPALRLKVGVYFYGYTGNSGGSAVNTDIMDWWEQTLIKAKSDPRVADIYKCVISDTPITMTRNYSVVHAREEGAHVLVMIDSDQNPQLHAKEPWYKPFWDVAFNEIYNHYGKGPLVICAPYVGSPAAGENVFAFQWGNQGIRGDETQISLDQFTRADAAKLRGLHEIAAGPTGLVMYDMRAFELIEPSTLRRGEVIDRLIRGEMSRTEALAALNEGWFRYEWSDQRAFNKASTEDVQNLRDISMAGFVKYGYNPLRCAFDSWIGHWKPWCCGKPASWDVDQISATFTRVIEENRRRDYAVVEASQISDSDFWERYMQQHGVVKVEVAGEQEEQLPLWEDHKTPKAHLDALQRLIIEESKQQEGHVHVLEIGSWKGDSAIAMAKASDNVMVTCVDTWLGSETDKTGSIAKSQDVFEAFRKNVLESGVGHRIKWHRMTSEEAAKNACRGLKYDVIFIDADHSYEATKNDIALWWPSLMQGGVMVGHDYQTVQFPGVDRAVHEFFGNQVEAYGSDGKHGCFWLARKPSCNEQ